MNAWRGNSKLAFTRNLPSSDTMANDGENKSGKGSPRENPGIKEARGLFLVIQAIVCRTVTWFLYWTLILNSSNLACPLEVLRLLFFFSPFEGLGNSLGGCAYCHFKINIKIQILHQQKYILLPEYIMNSKHICISLPLWLLKFYPPLWLTLFKHLAISGLETWEGAHILKVLNSASESFFFFFFA